MNDAPKARSEAALVVEPMAILEHLPVTAYLLRATGDDFVLEGVNAAGRHKTPGLSSMLGRKISLLYTDQPQIIDDARRAWREQVRVTRETTVRRHERVEGVRQSLVFAPVGAEHIAIYAQEREDEANASAELSEVQERYRSLLDSLPVAMLLRDVEGRVLACNDLAAEIFGHDTASDLWGKIALAKTGHRFETAHGAPIRVEDSPAHRAVRLGTPITGELIRAIAPSGAARWLRVSVRPVRKLDGQLGGTVTICAEDTERVEAQRAEREAALQLQMALDAGRMGTWRYDPSVDHGDWSPALDAIFGLKGEAPTFGGYLGRVHPDDRASVAQTMQQVLGAADGQGFEHEHRLLGDDGATRWARITGRIERSAGGVRLFGTAMDVTERRRMQDELLHASRLESLGRLAGGLAHDFNNLLAAMLGTVELLGDVCPESGKEDLATLRHITLRARDLTAQLLAFARQQRTELETLELGALVRKVERLLRRLVGPTIELVIEIRAEPANLHVYADAAQLEQVLVNLVVNARDAMPKGGRVTITLTSEDVASPGRVVLAVKDQGGGIQSQHLAHVFDPFFTTKPTGTGLGLASSYGVVKAHGGTISVESEPGKGAVFKVSLPRVTPARSGPQPLTPNAPGGGRVLVVDDDEAVRTSTARMLQTLGYEVLTASSGEDAEALARRLPVALDLLVCDLAMPNRSGHDVALALTHIHPELKVLFVSGYPRGAERELPADTFLQKPYDRDTLARKLAALRAEHAPPRRA